MTKVSWQWSIAWRPKKIVPRYSCWSHPTTGSVIRQSVTVPLSLWPIASTYVLNMSSGFILLPAPSPSHCATPFLLLLLFQSQWTLLTTTRTLTNWRNVHLLSWTLNSKLMPPVNEVAEVRCWRLIWEEWKYPGEEQAKEPFPMEATLIWTLVVVFIWAISKYSKYVKQRRPNLKTVPFHSRLNRLCFRRCNISLNINLPGYRNVQL